MLTAHNKYQHSLFAPNESVESSTTTKGAGRIKSGRKCAVERGVSEVASLPAKNAIQHPQSAPAR
jgi:hypothetical protein